MVLARKRSIDNKKYILITGGELRNKGAQAMSFIVINEMKRRFSQCEPVLVSPMDAAPDFIGKMRGRKPREDAGNLDFEVVWGRTPAVNDRFLGTPGRSNGKRKAKSTLLGVLRIGELRRIEKLLKNAAFIVDISGFAFGHQWGFDSCREYLRHVELARKFGVPVYLLPQSFGPFDFADKQQAAEIKKMAAELLTYPRIVFAREKQGYDDMRALCPLANVVLSNDLVLQNSRFDLGSVFKRSIVSSGVSCVINEGAVGIVPNMRNADHGDVDTLDILYQKIVKKLLDGGREVFLIRHAAEDIEYCRHLKGMFLGDERVRVMGDDLYCFEYEEMFVYFDFMIASRFHSIVHAYKAATPCIALGWAGKYHELLGLFGQERFVFDVTKDINASEVLHAVDDMVKNHAAYSKTIVDRLPAIQAENVFDLVEQDFRTYSEEKASRSQ